MEIVKEAIFVGVATVIVGTLISNIIKMYSKQELPEACKDWNKNNVMELSLFLTGFILHIVSEQLGINKWYCKNGIACKK